MKNSTLFALWSGLFILCGGLGFIPEPAGFLRAAMTGLSVVFFLPPSVLLYRARKTGSDSLRLLVRNLCALWLVLTLVLLVLNFLSALSSEQIGSVLYYILVIVSSPMICSGYWVLPMFLWSCLLMASLRKTK